MVISFCVPSVENIAVQLHFLFSSFPDFQNWSKYSSVKHNFQFLDDYIFSTLLSKSFNFRPFLRRKGVNVNFGSLTANYSFPSKVIEFCGLLGVFELFLFFLDIQIFVWKNVDLLYVHILFCESDLSALGKYSCCSAVATKISFYISTYCSIFWLPLNETSILLLVPTDWDTMKAFKFMSWER